MKAAFAMQDGLQHRLFDQAMQERLRSLVTIDTSVALQSLEPRDVADLEVLITGWYAPRVTPAALEAMPRLRAIVHTGGTVRSIVDPSTWERGILVTTAAEANAAPVADFTLGLILLAAKKAMPIAAEYARRQAYVDLTAEYPDIGSFGMTVGIIGASRIGRRLIELLRPFPYRVVVSDPFLDDAEAAALGVEKVELHDLLEASDIVSLHAPDLPSTRGMLGAAEFSRMRTGATFINTARQALVDQDALLDELRAGRIDAMLDVTEPEPLTPGHPLFSLPNVFLTPHLAGSSGRELFLLGASALAEVERIVHGERALHPVDLAALERMA